MTSRSLEVDRYLVAAAVVLTCVLFLPAALDPVNVIKLTALLLAVVALGVSVLARVLRDRVVHLPVGPAGWVAVSLLLAFVVSAVVAPVTSTAILGAYGRNSGLLAYVAAIMLLVVSLRVFDRPGARVLVGGVVAAGLFTGTYGLLQKAGVDAIPWNNPFNPIIAGLGNPNFASGYLGIAASVGAGGALWTGWAAGWRVACGTTAALCLLTAALSASVQGPIAAAGGLFVVSLAWVLDRDGGLRRGGLLALSGAALAGAGVLLAGALTKTGPAAGIFSDVGSEARTFYWGAALEMFSDRPLLGRGLDQYGNFWRSARSPESAVALSPGQYSDAAHSVPLQMLAQGGLLLGLVYGAFLLLTGVALVRGLLRLQGPERMLLASVGAGWAAYQVQSFVSIDQVPLLVLHFSLAGAVLACAGMSGLREVRLSGAPEPATVHPNDARARKRLAAAATVRRRELTGVDLAVLGLVGVLALGAAWQSLVPLRANIAVKQGDDMIALGDGNAALVFYERATELLPGQAFYALKKGQFFQQVAQPARARAAFDQAVSDDPYEVNATKAAAGLAEEAGDLDRARELHQLAVRLDPYNDATIVAAAAFELRHGGAEAAVELLEPANELLPGSAALWATLADARAVRGDEVAAREAYERALAIDPEQPVATAGLQKLQG